MPVAVQLPGYQHAQAPAVSSLLDAINGMRRTSSQNALTDTENEQKQLELSQSKRADQFQKDSLTPGTSASDSVLNNVMAKAQMGGDLAEKQGLSRAPFDQVLDFAKNGKPVPISGPTQEGEMGPQNAVRSPISGGEASRMLDSNLYDSLVSMQKPQYGYQGRVDSADIAAQGKADAATAKAKASQGTPGAPTKAQDATMGRVQGLLESARGNPAAGQAEKDLYGASKLSTLIKSAGDPNNLIPAQVQLIATEVAKMASGGVPSDHELQGLNPATLPSEAAKLAQAALNDPKGAEAGKFVKLMGDYSNGIAKDAMGVIQDKYGRIIETNRSALGPHYNDLKAQYIDRFKNSEQAQSAANKPHQHDDAAINWAKANPTDPRSAQILKANGL